MKKVMIISSMLFIGMMMFNNVVAQNDDDFLNELDKLEQEGARECWKHDLQTYMYAKGYSDEKCSSKSVARQSALEDCRRDLTERIEQVLDGAIKEAYEKQGISLDSEEANARKSEIKSVFERSLKKSLGILDRCYVSIRWDKEKGNYSCIYYGRLPKAEFKKNVDTDFQNIDQKGVDESKLKKYVFDKITSDVNNNVGEVEGE